jgi:transposase
VHTAINAVIAAARRHSARVVLEDLTIQRRLSALPRGYRGGRGARNFRRIIGRQQYGRVEHVLGYKLSLAGLPQAMKVRPHGTSITCPICGHADKANRPKIKVPDSDMLDTSRFACQRCGYAKDADINAGRVIALKGQWLSGLPTKAARGGRELSEKEKFPAWLADLIARQADEE